MSARQGGGWGKAGQVECAPAGGSSVGVRESWRVDVSGRDHLSVVSARNFCVCVSVECCDEFRADGSWLAGEVLFY